MDEQRDIPRDHNLNELFDMIRKLSADFGELKGGFSAHVIAEEKYYEQIGTEMRRLADEVEVLTSLHTAFPHTPDGVPDLAGHRADHDSRMYEAEEAKALRKKIKESAIEKIVTALLIGLVVVIGLGLKDWLRAWLA